MTRTVSVYDDVTSWSRLPATVMAPVEEHMAKAAPVLPSEIEYETASPLGSVADTDPTAVPASELSSIEKAYYSSSNTGVTQAAVETLTTDEGSLRFSE